MHRRIIGCIALLASLSLPALAAAEVLWKGDYETGDISQWTRAQEIAPDRLQVVESPRHQGRYALRAEVRQGDNPIGASGNRNELVYMSNETEGDERFYGWSTLWPNDYPLTPTWQSSTQWHHSGSDGAPPVRFILGCSAADCGVGLPDTLFFIVTGHNVWTTQPLQLGVWHNFVLHIKWSSDPSVGFVELWLDGKQVVAKTNLATLYAGQTVYLKQGLYRDAATAPTAVLYHDGFTAATTLNDVAEFIAPADAVGTSGAASTAGDTGTNTSGASSGSNGSTAPQALPATGCSAAPAAPAGALLLVGLSALGLRRRKR